MNKKISFAVLALGAVCWVALLLAAAGFPQFNGFHIGDGSGLTNLNTTNFTGFLQVSNMPSFVLTNAHQPHIGIGNSLEITNLQNGLGKMAIGAGGSFAGYDFNLYGVVNQAFFNSSQYNFFDQNNVQFMALSRPLLNMFFGDIAIRSGSNWFQGMGSSLTNTWTADYITGRASPVPPLQYNVLNDIGVPGGASTNGVIIGQMAAAFSNGIVNLSTNGMRAAGWRWAILDDGWAQTNRDANNNLQVDANSIPGGSNGLWLLFGFSHTNGFSNILYTSYHDTPGFNTTCSGRAGTPSWLVFNDVDKTLGYGVDGYKVDLCFPGGENRTGYQKEFRDFTSAFQVEFERAVITNAIYLLYSYFQNGIGPGRSFTGSGLDEVYFGNQGECGPVYSQGDITSQLFALKAISAARPFIRPGHYLEVCAISGLGGFSGVAMDTNQLKNAIIVNTIGAAPIVSSSYSNQPALAAICVNTNWISVHQNPAVVPGFPVLSNNLVETWLRPLGGGNLYGAWNVGSSNAVALFNMNVTPQTVNTYWTNLGLPSTANIQVIDDMDSTNVATFPGGFSITVPQTNAMLFTLMPNPTNGIIWVAPGPTNAETGTFSGTGSYQAPFTGDFDIIRSNAPAFTTMMLLPGNYYTDCSQLMKAHQRIVGSGMDITTIIRDPTTKPATNGPSINVLTATTGADYCEAYDLTLNCNATGTETNSIAGINWLVNGVTIKRVKIINWTGNFSTGREAFAIAVGGANGVAGDSYSAQNLISDVTITNSLGTYGNGILMQTRGLVQDWKVSFGAVDNTLTTQHMAGISTANGDAGVTFENGICYGGTQGFYTDTGYSTNTTIRNNQFIGVRRGIEFAKSSSGVVNPSILWNKIEIASDTYSNDGLGISIWGTNGVFGPTVIGNSIRMVGDTSFSTNSAPNSIPGIKIQLTSNVATNGGNFKVIGNTLATNMSFAVQGNFGSVISMNTDLNGNLVDGGGTLVQNASGHQAQIGNLNMNKLTLPWSRMLSIGNLRTLSIGDSTEDDLWTGLGRYFEGTIGINGTGVGGNGGSIAPWVQNQQLSNSAAIFSANQSGVQSTNWPAVHFFVSNNAAVFINRLATADISSSVQLTTNVAADTATFMWVNRVNGGSANLEVFSNNFIGGGSGWITLATVNSSAASPSFGVTNFYFPITNNYTWRITGTGGGDGAFELIGGGLTISTNTLPTGTGTTNSTGHLHFTTASAGIDYSAFVAANSNILYSFITNSRPDVISFASEHTTPLPPYLYNLVTNAAPNAQVIMISQHEAISHGSNYTIPLIKSDFAFAASNGIPFLDIYSYTSDTNLNFNSGWYNGGTDPHFGTTGFDKVGDIFLAALGLGSGQFGAANNGQPGNALALSGNRAGLFNTESKQPVGIGTPIPIGKFSVVPENLGGMLSLDGDIATSTHALQIIALNQNYPNLYGIPPGNINHSNAVIEVDPSPGVNAGDVFINSPSGGPITIGVINQLSFAGSPNTIERSRWRSDGAFVVGQFDYTSGAPDIGEGTIDARRSVNIEATALQLTNIGTGAVMFMGSNSLSAPALSFNGMGAIWLSNSVIFGEVRSNGVTTVFKIGPP